MSEFFTGAARGVRLWVRLTPKASANRIGEKIEDADGKAFLKAAVTAAPEGGKANAALIELLAGAWKLPKSSIEVNRGKTDRNKTLFIRGDTDEILKKLQHWADGFFRD